MYGYDCELDTAFLATFSQVCENRPMSKQMSCFTYFPNTSEIYVYKYEKLDFILPIKLRFD